MTAKKKYLQRNLHEFNILLEDGSIKNGANLIKQLKKEYNEETEYYKYKEGRYIFHIPKETAKILITTKHGRALNTVVCKHCKKNIMMTRITILKEDMSICPLCYKNMYDKLDKKIRKNIWN